jgi:Lar family restriction alleviation protein
MANFKPCPFCGCPIIRLRSQEYGFTVDCIECGAMKRVYSKFKKQAKVEWNQRREPRAVALEEESLKRLTDEQNLKMRHR